MITARIQLWAGIILCLVGAVLMALAFVLPHAPTAAPKTSTRTAAELLTASFDYWDSSGIVESDGVVTSWVSVKGSLALAPFVHYGSSNNMTAPTLPGGHKGIATTDVAYFRNNFSMSSFYNAWSGRRAFIVVGIVDCNDVGGGLGISEYRGWSSPSSLDPAGADLYPTADVTYYNHAAASVVNDGASSLVAANKIDGITGLNNTAAYAFWVPLGTNLENVSLTPFSDIDAAIVTPKLTGKTLVAYGVSYWGNVGTNKFVSYAYNALPKGYADIASKNVDLSSSTLFLGRNAVGPTFSTVLFFGMWSGRDIVFPDEQQAMAASLLTTYADAIPAPELSYGVATATAYVGSAFTLTMQNTGGQFAVRQYWLDDFLDLYAGYASCDVDIAALTGLSFDPETGSISGTPTQTYSGVITVSATNDAGTGSVSLTLVVLSAEANDPLIQYSPSSTIVAYLNYPLTPPHTIISTGVTAPTVYTIYPDLPPGMQLDPLTGTISGTPTELREELSYVITGIADENYGTTSITLRVVEPGAPIIVAPVQESTVYFDMDIEPILITSSGGPVVDYSISPDVAAIGLDFDPTTGTISGRANALQPDAQVYTVSASGPGGDAQTTLTIRCILRHRLKYASDTFTWTVGTAVSQAPQYIDVVSDKAVSSVPTYLVGAAFHLEGAAIAGVSVSSSGEIRGTPTAMSGQEAWRITATTATVAMDTDVSVRCNGILEFNGAQNLLTDKAIRLTPSPPKGETIVALDTGPLWPQFLRVSKTFVVTGTASVPTTITLDCTARLASGAQAVCTQKVQIKQGAKSVAFNAPMLYSGAGSLALGASLLAHAKFRMK